MKVTSTLELTERAMGVARQMLESAYAHDTPFGAHVVFMRGGEFVCTVFPHVSGFDPVESIIAVGASAFAADVVLVASDIFVARVDVNPVTGKGWAMGEMTSVVQEHQGRENGWVKDVLMVTAVNRAGDIWRISHEYSPVNGKVEWGKTFYLSSVDDQGNEDLRAKEGALAIVCVDAMERPTAASAAFAYGFTPELLEAEGIRWEHLQDYIDGFMVRILPEITRVPLSVLMSFEPGTERENILQRNLWDVEHFVVEREGNEVDE